MLVRHAGALGDALSYAPPYYRFDGEEEDQRTTYVPEGLACGSEDALEHLNQLNEELLRRLRASGEVFLSNAVVRGAFALRACIVSFRTSLADMRAVPGIVARHRDEVARAPRGR